MSAILAVSIVCGLEVFLSETGSRMRSFLSITRQPYEEPYLVNLWLSIGNPSTQCEFEIYANATDLNDAAIALIGFPKSENDSYTWESGSEHEPDRFACHFRLRVFQFSPTGRCAIEIRFNNNLKSPKQQIVEFSIEAYPIDIDRLGRMLREFSRLENLHLEWSVHDNL